MKSGEKGQIMNNSERVKLKHTYLERRFYCSILSGLKTADIYLPPISSEAIHVYPFQGFFLTFTTNYII